MKFLFDLAVISALMLAIFALSVFAQDDPYEEIAHDVRQVAIGVDGSGGGNSLSATLIVPFEQGKTSGWAGGFAQQQSNDGEVIEQMLNAHATGGYALHDRVDINAFVDWTRDKERGIAGQSQIGAFVNVDIYADNRLALNGGAGNFVENKQARDDLGLKDTDPNVVRALAYVQLKYDRYVLMNRFTPQIDFSDLQFMVEPTATYSLSDKLSLVVKAKLGYETEPLVEGEEFYTSYQLQLSSRF